MFAASKTAAVASAANYIEDVFSAYLYSGTTGTSRTITNSIDLAGKGGMVWTKCRGIAYQNWIFDTSRGVNKVLVTSTTAAETTKNSSTGTSLTAFNADGYNLVDQNGVPADNGTLYYGSSTYVSWTFRKQAKFFDVVTYTGNSVAGRTIAHSLGSVPGCIIVKKTSASQNWAVYHRGMTSAAYYMYLNNTAAQASANSIWNSTAPTSTVFTVGSGDPVNTSGDTYVAYLFAHDAGGFGAAGTDNVISCGSYTGNGSTAGPTVTLGYEPQFVMIKLSSNSAASGSWYIWDSMRGMSLTSGARLEADLTDAEASSLVIAPNATGFQIVDNSIWNNNNGYTYIYIAIRRGPMRTPTSGTSVFNPVVYTGTNVDNRLVDMSLLTDMAFVRQRNDTVLGGMVVGDRLRGDPYLLTGTTAAEVSDADSFMTPTAGYGNSWSAMNGFGVGNDATSKLNASTTSNNQIAEGFRRAPGFFDVVCYTGTGADMTIPHNLGVKPEIIILKKRSAAGDNWPAFWAGASTFTSMYLNSTQVTGGNAGVNLGYGGGNALSAAPTSTNFYLTNDAAQTTLSATFVAYLFATVAGVSKVGSYTGTGTTLQIDCGFAAGARFVLIKRTDSTGDWYVWDSARGIVAGNDPYLLLNSTAAEVTNTDYVDTYSAGFEISSTAPAAINANGGTFIFLAIA